MTGRDLIVAILVGAAEGIAIARGEIGIALILTTAFFALIALRPSSSNPAGGAE